MERLLEEGERAHQQHDHEGRTKYLGLVEKLIRGSHESRDRAFGEGIKLIDSLEKEQEPAPAPRSVSQSVADYDHVFYQDDDGKLEVKATPKPVQAEEVTKPEPIVRDLSPTEFEGRLKRKSGREPLTDEQVRDLESRVDWSK